MNSELLKEVVVNEGIHQVSVLSPFIFSVLVDVSHLAREG